MVKKQALVVLVSLVSFIGSAFGLGLGDINVKSNLNDPLVAEIPLLRLQGLSPGEILPSLASNDDFRRAGIERNFFLSNVQFLVVENEMGQPVIQLSTRQPVREPFLNFLVEVNWPSGRLLREYTILLDPPVFDTGVNAGSLVIESSSGSTATTQLSTSTVVQQTTQTTEQPAPAVAPRDDNLPEGQYRVQRNDTLWEIALRVPAGEGYSPQQVMLAIQDLNPQAFLNSNINRVKAGSVLQLPSEAQIAVRTLQEAVNEVAAQNRGSAPQLRAPVENNEMQLSATDSTASALPDADAEKNPDGYLELASESSEGVSAAGEPSEAIEQLRGQLAVAEELNDQLEREREQLQSQVADLQSQLEIMERLVELQSEGMTEVQEAVQSIDEQTEAAEQTPVVEEPVAEVVTPEPEQAPVVAPVAPPVDKNFMWYVNEYTGMAMAWLTASLTNTIIAIAVPLLLLLLIVYSRSRKNLADEDDSLVEEAVELETDNEDFAPSIDDLLSIDDSEYDEPAASEELEQIDGVMEAEMYMAYQKFDQAEVKLREAFAEHPDRSDIALKLLEVYAETGNSKAFADIESKVTFDPSELQQVEEFRARMPLDQSDDDFADFGDDLDLTPNESVEASDSSDSLDTDFDFDLNVEEPSLEVASAGDADLDLDDAFELSLDTDTEQATSDDSAVDDLDFSLDLGDLEETTENDLSTDLDFNLDDAELNQPSEPSETDADLDFTLDFGDELESDEADGTGELLSEDDTFDFDLQEETETVNSPETMPTSEDELSFDMTDGSLDEPELTADDFTMEFDADENDLDLDFGASETLQSEPSDEPDMTLALDEDDSSAELSTETEDPIQALADTLDSDAELEEDEFDFLSGNDEASTKLDLARAYIEMEDKEGARDILEEVAQEGNPEQQAQAKELLAQL